MFQKKDKFEMMPPGEPIRKKLEKQKKKEEKKQKEIQIRDQRRLEKKALRESYSTSTKSLEDQIRQKLAKRKIGRSSDKHNSGGNSTGSVAGNSSCDNIPVVLDIKIVEKFISLLVENGALDELGIFRVSGRFQYIQSIYRSVVTESDFTLDESISFYIHDVSSAMKLYFTNLPDPLCPFSFYDRFTAVSFEEDSDTCSFEILQERINTIKNLLNQLPELNRKVLEIICKLIQQVSDNQNVNKMSVSNCGVVFGPVIFRPKEVTSEYIFQIRTHGMLVEHFITFYKEIFEDQPLQPKSANDDTDESSANNNNNNSEKTANFKFYDLKSEQRNSVNDIHSEFLSHSSGDENNFSDSEIETKGNRFSVLKQIQQKVIGNNANINEELNTLKVGDMAPDFVSFDQRNAVYSLYKDSINLGKKVILFFYPKAFSENEMESATFRNAFSLFYYANCDVIGISSDSRDAQYEFSSKHALPFRLISDENSELRKMYGVPTVINGLMPSRFTFVINQNGEIMRIYKTGISHRPEEYTLDCLAALSDVLIDEQHQKTRVFRKRGPLSPAPQPPKS